MTSSVEAGAAPMPLPAVSEGHDADGARAAGDSRHGKVVQDDRFVGGPCLANPESLQGSTKLFLQVLGAKLVLNSKFSKN